MNAIDVSGPKIGVFGTGAIGSVIAGYLCRAGLDVTVVDPWFEHIEWIRRRGLQILAIEESFAAHPRALTLDQLDDLGTVDVAIIATKSYDTEWMAKLVQPHLCDRGVALSAQNGMNEPVLQAVFGSERVVGCVVPMAAELGKAAQAKRTSSVEWGTLMLGELDGSISPRILRLNDWFAPLGGVQVTERIDAALWGKLTLNVMSNGVAGVTGYTTRRLWSDDSALDVLVATAHETAALAEETGVRMDPVLKTIDHDLLLDADTLNGQAWREVKLRLTRVAETRTGAKENVPSLLQDIRKRRRTEIDYLNGWVALQASQAGLSASISELLVGVVHSVEIGESEPGRHQLKPLTQLVFDELSR